MANPAIQLTFKRIAGTPGGYQEHWEERNRPGISGHRFYFMGKRGRRKQLQVVQYFATQGDAENALTAWQAAAGREIEIISELDARTYQVFLHRVEDAIPRKVVSTLQNVTYRITTTIEVTQTA